MPLKHRERPLVLFRGLPQIMLPLLRLGELAGERLVELGVERVGGLVPFEQDGVGGGKVPSQVDRFEVLAVEDEAAFDGFSVCVRPGEEPLGAPVGISATAPIR